jgi:hypothetical protein
VRDIEEAGLLAHLDMFVADSLTVLDRHREPGERDHPRAQLDMFVVKWCSLQLLVHRGYPLSPS